MMAKLCWILITIMLWTTSCRGRFDGDVEHKLIDHLFTGYRSNARPVFNKSEAVHVKLDIAYSQLVQLDGKTQILSSKVWIRQMWTNPFLTWNPKDYGGLASINVDSKMVWKPDIVLYNNIGIGQTGAMYKFDTKVVIEHDGKNSWFAPTQIQSICKIDITFFPFDEQHCKLVFGSWTYTGKSINLVQARNESDLSKYTVSGEWDLVSAPVQRNVVKYACCDVPFIDVTFHFIVRRRVLFYLSNLILPSIILTVLTVFSFFLPPESGERISLVITILLGLTVFMLVFTESVPNTSEVIPLIGKFSFVVMCEVALSLLVTCLIMRIYHKGHRKNVPVWIRFVTFKILAPMLRVKRDIIKDEDSNSEEDAKLTRKTNVGNYAYVSQRIPSSTTPTLCCEVSSNGNYKTTATKRTQSTEQTYCSCQETTQLKSITDGKLDELCKHLRFLTSHLKESSKIENRKNDWHFVATVLDSAFYWLFLLSMVISTVVFYFQIPNARKLDLAQ